MARGERDPIREARIQWLEHGWGPAADGMAMVTSIFRVQQLLMERIDEALRPLNLSFARYEVLMLLSFSSAGALPMARVGALLQVHPSSATSAVARLERQGLVKRARDLSDKRVVLTSITGAGRELAGRATAALNSTVFEAPGIDPEAVRELTRLLGAIRAAAGDVVIER